MQTVNYYDVLGVSPGADDFVIKAAYKALAQRYHPDKFHGNAKDASDAEAKMRQLNEAYQVLSDPATRKDYDAHFQQGAQQNQQNSQQKSEQAKQQADWAIALRFYPDLTELEIRLGKIDPSLISEFRSSLLASQQYEQRQRIASQLEQGYLEDYFGNDSLIVDFARELLLAGKRDGAKELNRILKVVGTTISHEEIIMPLEKKYFPDKRASWEAEWKNIQEAVMPSSPNQEAVISKYPNYKKSSKESIKNNDDRLKVQKEEERRYASRKMRESWGLRDDAWKLKNAESWKNKEFKANKLPSNNSFIFGSFVSVILLMVSVMFIGLILIVLR